MKMADKKATDSEHYAWNAKTAERKAELERLGAVQAPQRISSDLSTGSGTPVTSPPAVGSAWNAAGTWEEKDVTAKGTKTFKEHLGAAVHILDGGYALTIRSVSKCEGEVRQVVSRGKPRLGFELTVVAEWSLVDGSGSSVASGSVTLEEVTDMDSDLIGSISATCSSCKGGPAGWTDTSAAASLVKKLVAHWRNVVKEWVEVMKQR